MLVLTVRGTAEQGLPGSVTRRAGRAAAGAAEDTRGETLMLFWVLFGLAVLLGIPFACWMMWMALESDRSHRNDFWKD